MTASIIHDEIFVVIPSLLLNTVNLMSYVRCNLVIPACPESILLKDSRQAGVTVMAQDIGYVGINS